MRSAVKHLSVDIGPRNFDRANALESAANYIADEFTQHGYKVERQKFKVFEVDEAENIVVSIGPENSPVLVIGAHYDSFGDQPGADDNASGIAGLLEIARLLKQHEHKLKHRVELVAYTLEEPPFFRTEYMGSFIHAKQLKEKNTDVIGMVSLEMIGFYSNEDNSQSYPVGIMEWFYPDKGNFIGVVSNLSSGDFKSEFATHMSHANIKVETLSAPSLLVGVDFSDHMNYWKFGYPAIMITDTAFYRNPNYHLPTDTIETLDFDYMAETVRAVLLAILKLET